MQNIDPSLVTHIGFPAVCTLIGRIVPLPWKSPMVDAPLVQSLSYYRNTLFQESTVINYTRRFTAIVRYLGALLVTFRQLVHVKHEKPVNDPFVSFMSSWSVTGSETDEITATGIGSEIFLTCAHLAWVLNEEAHTNVQNRDFGNASSKFELAAQALDMGRATFQRNYTTRWPMALTKLKLPELLGKPKLLHVLAQQCLLAPMLEMNGQWIAMAVAVQKGFQGIPAASRSLELFALCHSNYWQAKIAQKLAEDVKESDLAKCIALYNIAAVSVGDALDAIVSQKSKSTLRIIGDKMISWLTTMQTQILQQRTIVKNAWAKTQLLTSAPDGLDENPFLSLLGNVPTNVFESLTAESWPNLSMGLSELLKSHGSVFMKFVGGPVKLEEMVSHVSVEPVYEMTLTEEEVLAKLIDFPTGLKMTRREHAIALRAQMLERKRHVEYNNAQLENADVETTELSTIQGALEMSLALIVQSSVSK